MRRSPDAIRVAPALLFASLLAALLAPTPRAGAQGFSLASPGRVPREHDTDIGARSTGDPRVDFMLHCQGCHQADGSGLAGAVPDLRGSVARIATMPGGREYLGRVPGVAQSQLDHASVAAVLNWMLREFDAAHVPEGFQPFTGEELAPLRAKPLVAASTVRAGVLGGGAY